MITLYGFGSIFPEGRGETKGLRAQWALEETGLPYRVHALDHTGGELDSDAYRRLSPFRQVPVIDDDGFVVAESAAVVLYLAEKAGKLIPVTVRDSEPRRFSTARPTRESYVISTGIPESACCGRRRTGASPTTTRAAVGDVMRF
jgi:glutaredoxin